MGAELPPRALHPTALATSTARAQRATRGRKPRDYSEPGGGSGWAQPFGVPVVLYCGTGPFGLSSTHIKRV